MADIFLTSSSTAPQSLALGDSCVVAQGVTLFVSGAVNPVSMTGSARLTALGAVISENADTLSIAGTTAAATVNVGQAGSMISMLNAAIAGTVAEDFFLNNAGLIQGFAEAIRLSATSASADFHMVNSGLIQSNGDAVTENVIELTLPIGGGVTFANTGTIVNGGLGGGIVIAGAAAVIANSGRIAVVLGSAVETGSAADHLTNQGTIDGDIALGLDADVLLNRGLIDGSVDLGEGSDHFDGRGGHVTGIVDGGAGNDSYLIDDGSIQLIDGAGTDSVTTSDHYEMAAGIENLDLVGLRGLLGVGNASGNLMIGSAGNDTLKGDAGNDTLNGRKGDNVLWGGLGNDSLTAGGEADVLRGGSGDDQLRVFLGEATVLGGSGVDTLTIATVDAVDVNLATGTGRAGQDLVLTLQGVENVTGGSSADLLNGNAEANRLNGSFGGDVLRGQAGNDELLGDSGSDTMSGGTGADRFVFLSVFDSALGSEDLIIDFNLAQDVIDLSAIQVAPGDDGPFTFAGTAPFQEGKAEVRFFTDAVAGQTVIEVRRAGSVEDDMQIILNGIKALTVDHFVL